GGAWSPDPLPVSAQYSLGGPFSVRGFPVGDRRGDSGYLGTFGLRRSFGTRLRWALRAFADAGGVSSHQVPPGAKKSESLASAGIGADAGYSSGAMQYALTLDVAQPVGSARPSDGSSGPQVYAQLAVSY
ncbi:MAG TPA: ShlB/FhaC/HecB family hemolysin secretion/activation protein, partial [Nevskiaceae bacterium]|nr:ShlB/FhaC/HecB family hemolysin secretion/activation protein [Nevskiaceae bacterium]